MFSYSIDPLHSPSPPQPLVDRAPQQQIWTPSRYCTGIGFITRSYIEATQGAVDSFLLNPQYADVLAIVKAARNGAVYGAKVRFPHARQFYTRE